MVNFHCTNPWTLEAGLAVLGHITSHVAFLPLNQTIAVSGYQSDVGSHGEVRRLHEGRGEPRGEHAVQPIQVNSTSSVKCIGNSKLIQKKPQLFISSGCTICYAKYHCAGVIFKLW